MQLVFSSKLLPHSLLVFRHAYFRKDMYMWLGEPSKIHLVGPGQRCLLVWCLSFSCHEIVHYSLFPALINCVTLVKTNSEALPGDGERYDAFFLAICMYWLSKGEDWCIKNKSIILNRSTDSKSGLGIQLKWRNISWSVHYDSPWNRGIQRMKSSVGILT